MPLTALESSKNGGGGDKTMSKNMCMSECKSDKQSVNII
jgi:hypothetical protein